MSTIFFQTFFLLYCWIIHVLSYSKLRAFFHFINKEIVLKSLISTVVYNKNIFENKNWKLLPIASKHALKLNVSTQIYTILKHAPNIDRLLALLHIVTYYKDYANCFPPKIISNDLMKIILTICITSNIINNNSI